MSKLFGSQGCSDDKNWLDFSSIFFKICRFRSSILLSLYSTRSDAQVRFDSGAIFLDQLQFFATHSNQWNCLILYRSQITSNGFFSCKGGAKGNLVPRVLSLPRESTLVAAGCVYACQPKPHRGWVLHLILSTLSGEVNVALLQTLVFWKVCKLFVGDPTWPVLRLYLNFYEYEMLIERELCLYFTSF